MPQLLVRDLHEDIVVALKQEAKRHHRSLQGEVKAILVNHLSRSDNADLRTRLEQFRASFNDRILPDSTKLIRQNRDER